MADQRPKPDDETPSSEGVFGNMLETAGHQSNPSTDNSLVLAVLTGRHKGKVLELERETVKIGRASDCDLRLSRSIGVSRHHAKITFNGTHYFVEDTNSRNGVLLNHDLIETRAQLSPGDILILDEESIIFQFSKDLGIDIDEVRADKAQSKPAQDVMSMPVTDPRAHERFATQPPGGSASSMDTVLESQDIPSPSHESRPTRKFDLKAIQTALEPTADEELLDSKTALDSSIVSAEPGVLATDAQSSESSTIQIWVQKQNPKGLIFGTGLGFTIAVGIGYALLS